MLQEKKSPQEFHIVTSWYPWLFSYSTYFISTLIVVSDLLSTIHIPIFYLFVTFSSSPHLPVLMATCWETPEQIWSLILPLSSAPLPRYQLLITLRGQTCRRAGRVAPPYPPKPRCPSTWSAPPTSCTNRVESSNRSPPSWPHWRARTRAAKSKALIVRTAQVQFLSTQIHPAWIKRTCNTTITPGTELYSASQPKIETWVWVSTCVFPITYFCQTRSKSFIGGYRGDLILAKYQKFN